MMLTYLIEGRTFYYWVIMIPLMLAAPVVFYYLFYKLYNKKLSFSSIVAEWSTIALLGWIGSFATANLETIIYSFKYPALFNYSANQILEGQRFYGSLFLASGYYILFKKKIKDYLMFMDIYALGAAFLLFFGKIACFISAHTGCAGTATDLPWACYFRNEIEHSSSPVHPKQIYDAIFYISFFITFSLLVRFKKINKGFVVLMFMIIVPIYLFSMGFISAEEKILSIFRLSHFFSISMFSMGLYYYFTTYLPTHNRISKATIF